MMAKYDHTRVDYLRQAEKLAHFAQSVKIDTRAGKSLGKETVAHVGEKRVETRTCYGCGEVGHLRAHCASKSTDSKGCGKAGSKASGKSKVHFTMAVQETGCESDLWILDSGSSRHLVMSTDLLDDMEDCESECVLADGDALRVTKKGSMLLHVTAGGEQRNVRLTDLYYAPGLARNIISYGRLEHKGFVLGYKKEQRVVYERRSGQAAFDVQMDNNILVVQVNPECVRGEPRDVIMAILATESAAETA